MPDRENVITHLQIIHTWASFARERDLQFFTEKHLDSIIAWTDETLALLKEQDERVRQLEEKLEAITKWRMNAGAFD